MLLSKVFLVFFILMYCAQFEVCGSVKESKVSGLSSAGGRRDKIQNRFRISKRFPSSFSLRRLHCSGNQKCAAKLNSRIRRPKMHRNRRISARCCKKKDNQCKRKQTKYCKKNKLCIIRFSIKCRRQLMKCKRRKSYNRRPSNCKPKRKQRNQFPIATTSLPITTAPIVKKKVREICTRPDECEEGLCCARHHHLRICKLLLTKGQICTKVFPTKRSPDMYQRCPCADGLTCSGSESRRNKYHSCQSIIPVT